MDYMKARNSDTGELLWKFKLPSGVIGLSDCPITQGHPVSSPFFYGVGGWPGWVWCSICRTRPPALARSAPSSTCSIRPRMGGGVMVFSLNGHGPYDDVNLGEYKPN